MRPHLAVLVSLLALLSAMPVAAVEITGTATYLARIAPPPGAVFEARLEDVSRADAPAETLGRAWIADAGSPPYAFAIPYDPDEIDPRGVYAVRAELRAPDGRLAFTTVERHPVLNRGAGRSVEIVMVRVSASAQADRPLVGTRWRLFAMGDAPVPTAGQREIPFLAFDGEGGAHGSGGCNRFRGSVEIGANGALAFGPIASTMMACDEETMRREQAVHSMLGSVESGVVDGDRLTLRASGAPLSVFVAENGP